MVSMDALHSLSAEMHGGMLTLAFACVMVVAASQLIIGLRRENPLARLGMRVRGYAEAASYVAIVGGLIGLLLSAYTGMYAWPHDVLLNSATVRNKITLSVIATVLWAFALALRIRFGRGLWTCPAMAVVYTLTVFVAFGFTGLAGSVGAHLTVGESVMDPLWDIIGMDIQVDVVLDAAIAIPIMILSIIALIAALLIARRKDLFGVQLAPETCQRFFKWDEPVIAADTGSSNEMIPEQES